MIYLKNIYNLISQDWRTFFLAIGIVLNILGTIILAVPLFKVWHVLEDDDYVIDGRVVKDTEGEEKHSYTYPWLLKNRKFGFLGLGLLSFGFLIQLLLIIL